MLVESLAVVRLEIEHFVRSIAQFSHADWVKLFPSQNCRRRSGESDKSKALAVSSWGRRFKPTTAVMSNKLLMECLIVTAVCLYAKGVHYRGVHTHDT